MDARHLARALAASRLPALVIYTGIRPGLALSDLAGALGAPLVSLLRAGIDAALRILPG